MKLIHSHFAADSDWTELLGSLVADMPRRLAALDDAVRARDLTALSFLVHQLKGACGSYGFYEITELAQRLEISLNNAGSLSNCEMELAAFCDGLKRLTAAPTNPEDQHAG